MSYVLSHAIRSKWFNWILEIMFPTNQPFAKSKIRNCIFSVKTLILTILPFWWFDQISWGIMVQTWPNIHMSLKCWCGSKIMKFDCKLAMVTFSPIQLIFRSIIKLTDQKYDSKLETWHWVFLGVYNDAWKSHEALIVQKSLWKPKP